MASHSKIAFTGANIVVLDEDAMVKAFTESRLGGACDDLAP